MLGRKRIILEVKRNKGKLSAYFESARDMHYPYTRSLERLELFEFYVYEYS